MPAIPGGWSIIDMMRNYQILLPARFTYCMLSDVIMLYSIDTSSWITMDLVGGVGGGIDDGTH